MPISSMTETMRRLRSASSRHTPSTSTLALTLALTFVLLLAACSAPKAATPAPTAAPGTPKVLAIETFLADITQNVAGDRLTVEALIPVGVDPHAFEPTPTDIRRVAESQVLIANGAGFESFLQKLLENAGGERLIIEAATGLTSRQPQAGELLDADHGGNDPHFWLDPVKVIKYTENIRDGLSQIDPAGKDAIRQECRGLHRQTARAGCLDHRAGEAGARGTPAVGDQPRELRLLRRSLRIPASSAR